jgi:hypothetical protein
MKILKRTRGYLLFSIYILIHGCSSPTSENKLLEIYSICQNPLQYLT